MGQKKFSDCIPNIRLEKLKTQIGRDNTPDVIELRRKLSRIYGFPITTRKQVEFLLEREEERRARGGLIP